MRNYFFTAMAMLALPVTAYASCPAITVADMKGVADGVYPQQFEKPNSKWRLVVQCRFRRILKSQR